MGKPKTSDPQPQNHEKLKSIKKRIKPLCTWKTRKCVSYFASGFGVSASLATVRRGQIAAAWTNSVAIGSSTAYSIFKNLETAQNISHEIRKANTLLKGLVELTKRDPDQILQTLITAEPARKIEAILQNKIHEKSYFLAKRNVAAQLILDFMAISLYVLTCIEKIKPETVNWFSALICILLQCTVHSIQAHKLNALRANASILSSELKLPLLDDQLISRLQEFVDLCQSRQEIMEKLEKLNVDMTQEQSELQQIKDLQKEGSLDGEQKQLLKTKENEKLVKIKYIDTSISQNTDAKTKKDALIEKTTNELMTDLSDWASRFPHFHESLFRRVPFQTTTQHVVVQEQPATDETFRQSPILERII